MLLVRRHTKISRSNLAFVYSLIGINICVYIFFFPSGGRGDGVGGLTIARDWWVLATRQSAMRDECNFGGKGQRYGARGQVIIDTRAPTGEPSVLAPVTNCALRTKKTHLNNLPTSRKLVLELFLHARNDGRIIALLDAVFGADDNFARFAVAEEKDLLRRKRDHEHGRVVLEEASRAHVHLPDVEHLRVGFQALAQVLLHRRPEHVIRLATHASIIFFKWTGRGVNVRLRSTMT
jgi:hypothetical protein